MKDIFRLFGYARGLYKYVIFVAIAGILIALLDMIAPFVIKFATDAISLSISSKTALKLDYLILLLIILAISYISSAILGNINGYIGDVLAAKMRFKLSCVYYDHLLILPQSYYDNENTGKIISRLDRAIADVTRFIAFDCCYICWCDALVLMGNRYYCSFADSDLHIHNDAHQ